MPRLKFTARNVKALKAPKEGFCEYFDASTPGFGLRVSSEGHRAWIIRYRVRGRRSKSSFSFSMIDTPALKDARHKAREMLASAAKGIDPAAPVRRERRADTVKELCERFIEDYAKPHKRSWRADNWIIEGEIVPALGNMRATAVKRGDIRDMLDKIVARGSPIQANRTLALVRKIYNWAIEKELGGIEANPAGSIKRPAPERQRDRVLTPDEISTLWAALGRTDVDLSELVRLALKLQLATGQRKGEVAAAEWPEMDLREKVWTIPGEKSKNGLPHRVPLSQTAIDLLGEIEGVATAAAEKAAAAKGAKPGDGGKVPLPRWLFPSPRKDRPVDGAAISHALRSALPKIGLKDVTPHDLRRTAASYMASLGINRLVIGKVLNHREPGVTAVYDRHGYDQEKRFALDAWARRLSEIISAAPKASNVRELRRG
jgi:integrase